MISTRYNQKIPFYLLLAAASSFVLSLFMLELFAGILVLLWLFEKNSEKKKAVDLLTLAVLVFGMVRLISIIFSKYPSSSIDSLYKESIFYCSFFAFNFYLKVLTAEKKRLLIIVFLGASVFASLTGIIIFNLSIYERAQSFTSGGNAFSSYLLAALPVLIFFPFEKTEKKYYFFWLAGLIIILTGLVTSMERTNIAIAVLIIGIGVWLRKLNYKNLILILTSVSLLSFISFQNNSFVLARIIASPLAAAGRDFIIRGAKIILYDHPFIGFGPRTFKSIYPLQKEYPVIGMGGWHNDFLQIYFESGIMGLLSFLFLLAVIYYIGIKILKNDRSNRDLVFGFLLSVSGYVLLVTSGFITSPVLSMVFVLIITLQNSYGGESYFTSSIFLERLVPSKFRV